MDAARDLFWEQGFSGTGIAQILRKADARSGSLYYFFETKEELLLAVLGWYKAMLGKMVLEPVFERIADPIERVFGILDGYRQQLEATNYDRGCPVGNLSLEVSNSHPAARQLIAENFTGWRNAVKKCLDEASDRLPTGTNTEQLALFVLTTMEGAVMLARTYRSVEPYDAAVGVLRDYLDRLLRERTDWPSPPSLGASSEPGARASSMKEMGE